MLLLTELKQQLLKWKLFKERCSYYQFTERQKEITILIAKGHEYKEIANKLNISYKTVTRHIEILFDKLKVYNKIDLINLFFNQ
jgi:DNA-binding NarL/FixJ family response regulator